MMKYGNFIEVYNNICLKLFQVAPIVMSRKVTNTRITANAFKINNLEYKYYETMVNLRLKQYNILLKTYNRLMCERTTFQVWNINCISVNGQRIFCNS